MSTNPFLRLRALLPQSPVIICLVVSHDTATDTSIVQLPSQVSAVPYGAGLETGRTFQARGTSVPIGAYAFVRNGVVETRAPDTPPVEIVIGRVVGAPPVQRACEVDPFFPSVALLLNFDAGGTDALAFDGSSHADHQPLAAGQSISVTNPLYGTGSLRISEAGRQGMFWQGERFARIIGEAISIEATTRVVAVAPFTSVTPMLWDLDFGRMNLAVSSPGGSGTPPVLRFQVSGSETVDIDFTPDASGKVHTAVAVTADNLARLYVQGVLRHTSSNPLAAWGATRLYVGGEVNGFIPQPIEVYLDRFRYTRGVARQTGNFTPPASEPCNGNAR